MIACKSNLLRLTVLFVQVYHGESMHCDGLTQRRNSANMSIRTGSMTKTFGRFVAISMEIAKKIII